MLATIFNPFDCGISQIRDNRNFKVLWDDVVKQFGIKKPCFICAGQTKIIQ